ncbi:Importin subunit beta-1 [Hordeum vulgare]|nr:Importin subunit beta-1 [Hordeum vulgare]
MQCRRRFAFAKSDVVPDWVRNDPGLVVALTLDHSLTTAETAAKHRCLLDSELAKIGDDWSLRAIGGGAAPPRAIAEALRCRSVAGGHDDDEVLR